MAGFFSACTFRELGAAATTQNLFSIANTDSSKLVYIRRLLVQMDATAVLTAQMPQIKCSRPTGVPTGGSVLSKGQFNTLNASNANTICRGSTASDGGANSGPIATPAVVVWQQYGMRMHTLVGQILGLDCDLLPHYIEAHDFVLRQDESLLVHIVAAATTSNPATNHYFVNCVWEEN